MSGAVSICHYGFQNARRSKFPTWNETAGVQVLCACAIPLPSSLSLCDVTKRQWLLRSRKHFVCCNFWSMNQLFLFSRHSGDNSTVIPHLPIALDAGISSFRQRAAFVKAKVQNGRVCQKKAWNEWDSLLRSPKKSVRRASRELEMSICVEGAAKETAHEALPSSIVAVSETDRPHRPK